MTGNIRPIKNRNESIQFIGNWHESIPRMLFMDPFMSAHDRNVYCVIRALLSGAGVSLNREMRFPDYREIMKYGNIGSRATVAKAITAARIIGWIVQNNPSEEMVRDQTSGRFKPKQWLFLDEPMRHSEICHYDHGYVAFIRQAAQRKQDEHIASLAQRVLITLLDDDSEEKNIYERRMDSYRAITTDSSSDPDPRAFGIPINPPAENPVLSALLQEDNPPSTGDVLGKNSQNPPSTVNELGKNPPSTGGELGDLHQNSANSPSTVSVLGKNHRVQEVNSVISSSSSSSKKTTTTNPDIVEQRTALFERIGFNPNFRSIYTTRFERLPDEYQALIILEMNARMDRKLNRNNGAYLGHLLKTTLSAVEQDDPGLLIFTPEYSLPKPAEKQSHTADPIFTLKQKLREAKADYSHWERMQQATTSGDQLKQLNITAEMAKTKIKTLQQQLSDMQNQSGTRP